MDANHMRRLIKQMLDGRSLMPETREELGEYLSDLDKGALHPDDAAYIEGLAQRLGHGAIGAAANSNAADSLDDDLADGFPAIDDEDHDGFGVTAAAVQAEVALRAIEQARTLLATLQAQRSGGDAADPDAPTLNEIEKALGDAADALTRRS